jgi:hypothetical protein
MQNQKKQEQVFNDCHDMNSLETEIQNETITKEWTKFDGDYEKAMHDIKLFNGDIITKCWPNAGYWHVCKKEDNEKYYRKGQILMNNVEYFKLTYY